MQTITSFRSFDLPVQVAVANMLANNVGFYMLVPFLAGGAAFDLARVSGFPGFPWLLMIGVGVACAVSVGVLDRSNVLPSRQVAEAHARARRPTRAPAR